MTETPNVLVETGPTDEPPTAPLVFLCIKCNTIAGDSFSLVNTDQENDTITLSAVSNIKWSSTVSTAKSGHDVGNAYFSFSCKKCEAVYGKYYLTTSKDLDYAREKFTFDLKTLSSYVLGQAEHGHISAGETQEEAIENSTDVTAPYRNSTLEIDMLQVQESIISLFERVGRIEDIIQLNILDQRATKRQKT